MFKAIKTSLVIIALSLFIIPSASFAQSLSISLNPACVIIRSNLSYSNRSNNNQEDVLLLQNFLYSTGYLTSNSVTGFFGRITERAVIAFQRDNGLDATPVGFVGVGTRAKIQQISCATAQDQAPSVVTLVATPSRATLSSTYQGQPTYPTAWVEFTIKNFTSEGDEVIYFGDGSKSAINHPSSNRHDYHTPGTYTVKLVRPQKETLVNGMYTLMAEKVLASTTVNIAPEEVTYTCTTDAYRCADGSWVGRTGSNCQFVCPVQIATTTPITATLQVSNPNRSMISTIGDTVTLSWSASQSRPATTTLALFLTSTTNTRDGGRIAVLKPTRNIQDGIYAWTIPEYIFQSDVGIPLNPGTYKIQAVLYEGENVCLGYCAYGSNTNPKIIASAMNDTAFTIKAKTSTQTGTYVGYMNGNVFITTQNISKEDALANCKTNALNNPASSVRCTWNGTEIYTFTPSVTPTFSFFYPSGSETYTLGGKISIVWGGVSLDNTQIKLSLNEYSSSGVYSKVDQIATSLRGDSKYYDYVIPTNNTQCTQDSFNANCATVLKNNINQGKTKFIIVAEVWKGDTFLGVREFSKPFLITSTPVIPTGTYIGYMNGNAFITTQNITKDNALANCKTNALNNPNSSIRCTWNGEEIYLYTPPVVAGTYVNRLNGAGVDACNADIVAKLGSQKYSCTLGGGCSVTGLPPTTSSPSANPYIAGACIPSSVWNEGGSGTVSTIDQTSANGPKYNAMSCTKPTLTAVADGEIGCYGLWDYGNEFGDDVNMCGSYGDRKTGCVVQTSACQSGTAINSKVISPSQLLSSEISQVASKLKASDLSVKNQIITLWPYVCTSQVVGRVSHQASPQVLGASVSTMCTNLPINLHRGMEKPSVSRLQSFLAEKGFLSKDNVTGFYGDKTVEAVKDYQASAGLPVTGMVYNFTRETIQVESCR